jgi:hypothetical protein
MQWRHPRCPGHHILKRSGELKKQVLVCWSASKLHTYR